MKLPHLAGGVGNAVVTAGVGALQREGNFRII